VTPYPGLVVDGKYRLGALLGQGGMGWVFEATHLHTDKRVALKYLAPGLQASERWLRRFAREARAAGRLDHPNVIRIYDVGGEGAGAFLVMERLRGETLRARLKRGALAPGEAWSILQAVMRGVSEAHRHAIVHGDLKPENIMLTVLSDGSPDQPKVLDFGVSRMLEADLEEGPRAVFELTGGGTPQYMPLEQLRGEPCNVQVDVYALGVMLYELLDGRRPFRAANRQQLTQLLESGRPPELALSDDALARRLAPVLDRALARDAAGRYASVEAFSRALSEAFTAGRELSSSASTDTLAPVMIEKPGLGFRRSALATALLLATAALIASTLLRTGSAAPRTVTHPSANPTSIVPSRGRDPSAASGSTESSEPPAKLDAERAPVGADVAVSPMKPPPKQRRGKLRAVPPAEATPRELDLRREDF
jgi:serine/threonine-protein kinase